MALIVITGANRGIGLALAATARRRGDQVIAAVRRSSKELEASGAEIHAGVDVTDDKSVAAFAASLKSRTIDILINNAGIHRSDVLDSLDFNRIREQIEVNALGPVRMTRALLPNLPKGAKVAIITSRSGSIADNGSGGNYGYRMSKAAVNMAGSNLALDLKAKGIGVAILHPGMVATDMGSGGAGSIPPALSAERLLARIDALTLATTGKFLHAEGHELPW